MAGKVGSRTAVQTAGNRRAVRVDIVEVEVALPTLTSPSEDKDGCLGVSQTPECRFSGCVQTAGKRRQR